MNHSQIIIGVPTIAKNRAQVDVIVACLKHNLKGVDRNRFTLVVDINGMPKQLTQYFQTKLLSLKAQITVEVVSHSEAGRTDAMNRIVRHALRQSNIDGVIFLNDDIILSEGALQHLSKALESNELAGGVVVPLDTGARKDTTLVQQAQLDFESRVRKKTPQLHGAFFGMSKAGLEALEKDGLFPPLHFEDAWLTIRHKMQHGIDKDIPIAADAQAYTDMPETWSFAVDKIARYAAGQKQMIQYFESQGRSDIAAMYAKYSNSLTQATTQFREALHNAEAVTPDDQMQQRGTSPDIECIAQMWAQLANIKPSLPSADSLSETLKKFMRWKPKENTYMLYKPEIALPLLNSIINLLGTYQAESRQQGVGKTWDRDSQLTRGPDALSSQQNCGMVCELGSAVQSAKTAKIVR